MGSSSHFPTEDKLREKSDYHRWKMSLDLILEEREVLDYVKGKILEPPSNAPTATKNKYTKGEVKVKKIIRDSIDKRLVAYTSELKSKEIYDRLVSLFKVSDANQVLFLKNKLKDIKKGKDEDIQSYFLRITEIKNDFLPIGKVIPDRELTITTLRGLPFEWYIFKTTLLNNDQISGFEELMSRCIQEETRMVEQEIPSNKGNPTAFSSHAKRRNDSGSKGHFKGKPGSKGGKKGICFVCNKFGHYARECPNRKDTSHDDDQNHSKGNFNNNNQRNGKFNGKGKRNARNQGNGQPSKKARNSKYESNVVNNKQDEYYLISDLSITSPPDSLGNWLINSGASRHFIGYKEALSNLIEKETNLEIILRDNSTYPVNGVGKVTLQLNQGNTIHLQEVLYVPNLKKNLVSISAMEDKGYKVAFIDGKVRVWKKNFKDAFTLGFQVDSLYHVGGSPLGVMSCDTSLQSELWHRRFAHLHCKALPNVRQVVTGMPEFKLEHEGVCLRYAKGKLKRGPFPSSHSKSTNILQLVHSDISDDYSHKTWIYFLKKKDEVFTWFRHFKALFKNQTEKRIKILRTDNGTEYESNEFCDFCKEVNIKRETTTPYIPEQNGVAERKNHRIVEVVHAMLHDQRLSKFLWAEAANTARICSKSMPSSSIELKDSRRDVHY
eukprot:PITA_22616